MTSMAPSIGRKVWLWASTGEGLSILDLAQAVDATVIFVHPSPGGGEYRVNLHYTDHEGNSGVVNGAQLRDPGTDSHSFEDSEGESCYATWMPSQMPGGAANKTATPKVAPAANPAAPAPTPAPNP